jgi:hypothetical protein
MLLKKLLLAFTLSLTLLSLVFINPFNEVQTHAFSCDSYFKKADRQGRFDGRDMCAKANCKPGIEVIEIGSNTGNYECSSYQNYVPKKPTYKGIRIKSCPNENTCCKKFGKNYEPENPTGLTTDYYCYKKASIEMDDTNNSTLAFTNNGDDNDYCVFWCDTSYNSYTEDNNNLINIDNFLAFSSGSNDYSDSLSFTNQFSPTNFDIAADFEVNTDYSFLNFDIS